MIGVEKIGGTYEQLGMARTLDKALRGLVDVMLKQHARGTALRVQVLHSLNPTAAEALHNLIDPLFKCTWLPINPMSPALAAHTGPTMVGVAYAARWRPSTIFPNMPNLRITLASLTFVARLEESDAARTCAEFGKLLPYRQKLIQARWSGEAGWIPLGDFKLDVDFEHHTSYPAPGEILFYPGGYSETGDFVSLRRDALRQQTRPTGWQSLLDDHRRPRTTA